MNLDLKRAKKREIYVRFSLIDYEELKAIAVKEDAPLSEVVRIFCMEALKEYKSKDAALVALQVGEKQS